METYPSCKCDENISKKYIALSCSGGSDLGELSDKVTHLLKKNMEGTSMNCLAKLGFSDPSLLDAITRETALVVDGCPIDCGRKILERNGITQFKHFRLTDFGFVKGQTNTSPETVSSTAQKIMDLL